jgi:hypothetical protein
MLPGVTYNVTNMHRCIELSRTELTDLRTPISVYIQPIWRARFGDVISHQNDGKCSTADTRKAGRS